MLNRNKEDEKFTITWKTKVYMVGSIVGATMGLLSAYLFAKEADAVSDDKEQTPEVSPMTMLGLLLSIVTLVRQIGETGGKSSKKGSK